MERQRQRAADETNDADESKALYNSGQRVLSSLGPMAETEIKPIFVANFQLLCLRLGGASPPPHLHSPIANLAH